MRTLAIFEDTIVSINFEICIEHFLQTLIVFIEFFALPLGSIARLLPSKIHSGSGPQADLPILAILARGQEQI